MLLTADEMRDSLDTLVQTLEAHTQRTPTLITLRPDVYHILAQAYGIKGELLSICNCKIVIDPGMGDGAKVEWE